MESANPNELLDTKVLPRKTVSVPEHESDRDILDMFFRTRIQNLIETDLSTCPVIPLRGPDTFRITRVKKKKSKPRTRQPVGAC